jgi:hypothetical protein
LLPMKESLANADPRKKVAEADPLVENGQKLIPSITHVFRKDQSLYVYMEVYDPGVDRPEAERRGDADVLPRQDQELRIAAGAARFVHSQARPDICRSGSRRRWRSWLPAAIPARSI